MSSIRRPVVLSRCRDGRGRRYLARTRAGQTGSQGRGHARQRVARGLPLPLRRPGGQSRHLRRRRQRRSLSPTTPAPRPAASGRRPTARIHWKPIFDDQPVSSIGVAHRRAVRSERRLGRHRRAVHPQPHLRRLGDLQVHRRRRDLGARRTRGDRPHRAHRDRSARSRARLRRRARPRLRAAAGARRSSARPTAARRGRRCSSSTTTPAPWTS